MKMTAILKRLNSFYAGIVFLISTLMVLGLTWWIESSYQERLGSAINDLNQRVAYSVEQRIFSYQYGLRGLRGTLMAIGPDALSPALLDEYNRSRDPSKEFPGARGFGFIRRVPAEAESDYLRRSRAVLGQDYSIRQLSSHGGTRYVIEYIYPLETNRPARGLDIASEINRRTAAEAAARTGAPTLTGPITLIQRAQKPGQSFLFLLPVYRNSAVPSDASARAATAVGWTYAPLSMDQVLGQDLLPSKGVQLQLTDVTSAASPVVFFTSGNGALTNAIASTTSDRQIFGRTWRFTTSISADWSEAGRHFPPAWVFAFGELIAIVLSALAALYGENRSKRKQLAATRAELAAIVEESVDAVIGVTLDGRVSTWNPSAQHMFGYSKEEAVGRFIVDLTVPGDRVEEEHQILQAINRGTSVGHFETVRQKKDGSCFPASISAAPIRNARGEVVGGSKVIRDVSSQKAAEQEILTLNETLEAQVALRTAELEHTQRTLRTIIDSLPSLIGYWDRNLNNLVANRAYSEWLGIEQGSIAGLPLPAIIGRRWYQADQAHIERVLGGERQAYQHAVELPDGRQRHLLTHLVPDTVGAEVRGFFSVVHDLSELVRLDEMLENVLSAATEVSIIATDLSGLIVLFNSGAERMLGYRADEMVGLQTPAILHVMEEIQQRASELSEQFDQRIEGFRTFVHVPEMQGQESRVWSYVCKDGHRLSVSLTVTAMRDKGGNLVGYLGMAVDVTEQLAQQRELMASKEQLELAAEVAHLGIWTWTLSDNALRWNNRMFELYDQPLELMRKGLQYHHWRDRVHPEDLAQTEASLQAAVAGTGDYDPEFRVLLPDGTVRTIQAAAYVDRDASGLALRVTGINLDISERRAFERTLVDARRAAESASAAKGMFLANMSHEIRTPLNATLGMLDLLRRTPLSDRQRDYTTKAQSASKSLLALLNDILDYSKIEADKLELDRHLFDLEELLRELGVVLSGSLDGKDIEVIFDIDTDIPRQLVGDRLRLQQVLINLAGNAVKFTSAGQVIVGLKRVDASDQHVTVRVSIVDSGIGISEEQREQIFKGFTQAETSTTRRYGGTGLGLAISKRLIELMGGQLALESRLGKGSQFWFDIRLSVEGVPDRMTERVARRLGRQPRVLVVDDNPVSCEVLAAAIKSFGWETTSTHDGLAACLLVSEAQLAAAPFDLILMDWRMPGLDGLAASEIILDSTQGTPAPVIIMVTAHGREAVLDAIEDSALSFAGILSKPITPVQILDTYQAVLEGAPHLLVEPEASVSADVLAGIRILIVEDNPLNRQVASELLSGLGALVSLAEGGLEGVQLATQHAPPPHIILMDLQMPDIDGIEATRRIRNHPTGKQVPIIAMTANVAQADREACFAAGMNDHVGKPISIQQLVPTVLSQLNGQVRAPDSVSAVLVANEEDEATCDSWEQIQRRFNGHVEIYSNVLNGFLPQVRQLVQEIEAGMPMKGAEMAPHLHNLKGMAATMGASGLARYLARLEVDARQDQTDSCLDSAKIQCILQLAEASAETLRAQAPEATAKVHRPPDTLTSDWQAHARRLQALLKDSDLAAMSELANVAAVLPREYDSWFEEVKQLVNQLRFLEAAQLLDEKLSCQ